MEVLNHGLEGKGSLSVAGGTFALTCGKDGLRSENTEDVTINGGTLDLTCNGSGNTALDTDGSYANNGGAVTTNDGSEEREEWAAKWAAAVKAVPLPPFHRTLTRKEKFGTLMETGSKGAMLCGKDLCDKRHSWAISEIQEDF